MDYSDYGLGFLASLLTLNATNRQCIARNSVSTGPSLLCGRCRVTRVTPLGDPSVYLRTVAYVPWEVAKAQVQPFSRQKLRVHTAITQGRGGGNGLYAHGTPEFV